MPELPTSTEETPEEKIYKIAQRIAKAREADVYLYSGSVEWEFASEFREIVLECGNEKNAILFLTTFGGSGDAAFQMARCLHSKYDDGHVAVLVATFCKSAGTLLTLGAKSVIMTELAELGPLDVQIAKPDTLGERVSGLTPSQSLTTLKIEAFQCFEKFFLDILTASGHAITTRTAAMIAAKVTAGLFQPIYAQIDPMRLGEFQRAVQIAMEYGKRLDTWSRNLKEKALSRLISGYPSHEFVIDRKEAKTLFHNVEEPTDDEQSLSDLLTEQGMCNAGGKHAIIRHLGPCAAGPEDGGGTPRPTA